MTSLSPSPLLRRLAAALLVLMAGTAAAQEPPADVPEAKARAKPQRKGRRPGLPGVYMGRQIAPVMTYQGAEWLIRPEREQEEQPETMLDALKIQPGSVVADVGAGVGYTSVRLAARVGPKGTVLATDVQPQMIRMLRENLRSMGVTNVKPILCTPTDSKLPKAGVDLILMVDVYHELADPEGTLAQMREALKPGGRIALIEFRANDPNVPIKPEHTMTVEQARKELEANGFKFQSAVSDLLPWQHIILFEKKAEGEPLPDPADPAPRTAEPVSPN